VQAVLAAQLGLRRGVGLSERLREGAENLAGLAVAGLGLCLLITELTR
jgi:hypothetical protein